MVLVIKMDYQYAKMAVAFLAWRIIHFNCQVFRTRLIRAISDIWIQF